MSKLREAAQAALEHWDKVSGIFRMTTETNRLRAALAQPENRPCTCHPDDNPPQPCAQRYALTECKALAQPETAEPVAWLHHAPVGDGGDGRALSFSKDYYVGPERHGFKTVRTSIAVVPLYAHPPRDEWRPASEPPEDGRDVVVWMNDGGHGCFAIGHCLRGEWTPNYVGSPVIRWRDVQPPTEGAAKCQRLESSGQICGLTPPCPDCGPSLIDVAEGA